MSDAELEAIGLEVIDVAVHDPFALRPRRNRRYQTQLEGLHRLTAALVERPKTILQELVETALELCEADSAGISIERENRTDEQYFEWVAVAGAYSEFMHAILPKHPSACTLTLERRTPQLVRADARFFQALGVEPGPLVTDGILLPWEVEGTRGTLFIHAHGRAEAFDSEDLHVVQTLASLAAVGVRHQRQQALLIAQNRASAAMEMANHLAHEINNPLQSLTNQVFLAGTQSEEQKRLALSLAPDLERLSTLVRELLALPGRLSKTP